MPLMTPERIQVLTRAARMAAFPVAGPRRVAVEFKPWLREEPKHEQEF
jgi:hypothetical protein